MQMLLMLECLFEGIKKSASENTKMIWRDDKNNTVPELTPWVVETKNTNTF